MKVDASVANSSDSTCESNFLASAQTANSVSAEAGVPTDSCLNRRVLQTIRKRVVADYFYQDRSPCVAFIQS